MKDFSWLPPLITLGEHSGDVLYYTDTLYQTFLTDLVQQTNTLFGKPVFISRKLELDGRHACFWHIITDPHSPRVSDIKHSRAERVSWVKAIIDNVSRDEVLAYERVKENQLKLYLYIPEMEYMVVLADRGVEYHLVTAFHIPFTYMIGQYNREYKQYGPKAKV